MLEKLHKADKDRMKTYIAFAYAIFSTALMHQKLSFAFLLSQFLQPRNKEQEKEVLEWIFAVLGEKVPPGEYEDILRDGQVLCKLANKLAPGSVKKIQERGTNFQLMENVQRFQAAIKKYGVPEEEIFQTADLFERRNIPQVTLCLYSLGRIVSGIHYYSSLTQACSQFTFTNSN